MKRTLALAVALAAAGLAPTAQADQPIMNMMPRWDGGYGWQAIHSFDHKGSLLDGTDIVSPGLSLYEEVHKTSFEAVYTWDKSIRMTAKLPYIWDAVRTLPDPMGPGTIRQRSSGWGDLQLAVPLKKYFNKDGRSGSWTFAPGIRIPTGSARGDYTLPDRAWGNGLHLGYETETRRWFFAIGMDFWEMHSHDPFEFHANLDLGVNFLDQGQFLWETDFTAEDDGTRYLKAGPALYWRFNDTLHARVEWKHTFYDKRGTIDHGRGDTIKAGLGWVF